MLLSLQCQEKQTLPCMFRTGFTVGGFTQPAVARGLIENPSNIEKGLCQRFLWLVPPPNPVAFDDLEPVDKDFCSSIGIIILINSNT